MRNYNIERGVRILLLKILRPGDLNFQTNPLTGSFF